MDLRVTLPVYPCRLSTLIEGAGWALTFYAMRRGGCFLRPTALSELDSSLAAWISLGLCARQCVLHGLLQVVHLLRALNNTLVDLEEEDAARQSPSGTAPPRLDGRIFFACE
jgi:hypothetical protein